MGMFTWKCKGCGEEIIEDEIARLNGCVGEYDGYGRCGSYDHEDGDPVAWHELCYQKASDKDKLDETPSEYGPNQGFGDPQDQFMYESYIDEAKKNKVNGGLNMNHTDYISNHTEHISEKLKEDTLDYLVDHYGFPVVNRNEDRFEKLIDESLEGFRDTLKGIIEELGIMSE